nr:MAG TPA_asm: hypothetical protein [Caudoviricetes sp.]
MRQWEKISQSKRGNRDIKIGIDTLEVFSVPCLC